MRFAVSTAARLLFLGAVALPAAAQSLPPTSRQLQQRQDQVIQQETNRTHDNLTRLQIQQLEQAQRPPVITPTGRAIAHPPGYIPIPTNPDR